MSDQITYGAGGVPYVGGNAQVPKKQDASEAPEEIIEEPKVIVTCLLYTSDAADE